MIVKQVLVECPKMRCTQIFALIDYEDSLVVALFLTFNVKSRSVIPINT